ncbi:hypothetical protein GGF50DRAFT_121857, partial [Schizophyllum commune]
MQLALTSLTSYIPEKTSTHQIDPNRTFSSVLENATDLEELQVAWLALINRLRQAPGFYEKYWRAALSALGDAEVEALSQPPSTPSTVYRRLDAIDDPHVRLKTALGALPSAAPWDPNPARDANRYLTADWAEVHSLKSEIRRAFPPREPEESPELIFYDDAGRQKRRPPRTTYDNPLDFSPVDQPQEQIGYTSREEGDYAFEQEDSVSEREATSKPGKRRAPRPSAHGVFAPARGGGGPPSDDSDSSGGFSNRPPPLPRPRGRPRDRGLRGGQRGGAGGGGDPNPPADIQDDLPDPPYGRTQPTINSTLKVESLPAWNGSKETAIHYFWTIVELASVGGYIPQALGTWLWTRLENRSPIQRWYMTQGESRKAYMRRDYLTYMETIKKHFLGPAWIDALDTEFRMQRFRDRKNPQESPSEFIYRRVMYSRSLDYAVDNSLEEVKLIMSVAPRGWRLMLTITTVKSTDKLQDRVIEFEEDLLRSWVKDRRVEEETNPDRARPAWQTSSASNARSAPRARAYAAELQEGGMEAEEGTAERPYPLDGFERDGGGDLLASAYSVAAKTANDRKQAPLFPPANHVKSQGKKPPPGPCFACGSLNHWNKDCPHWEEFSRRRKAEGYSVEIADEAAE